MPDGQDRSSKQGDPNTLSSPPLPKYPLGAFYPGTFSFRWQVMPNHCAQKPFLLATLEISFLHIFILFCPFSEHEEEHADVQKKRHSC